MRTFRQTGVIVLMAITFSVTGVAVATGYDVVVVTATVDGKAGYWEPGRSATPEPEPTPAIETTTPSATPSAEPVIPATTATPTSSTPTEGTASPSEPAPTTEP
ncbi:hypothetical protein AB0F52_44150 [Amycolatopsis sp. NPDC024027]|uniref:hypothetical protein n=1 Tax=Amycolatopsis sp. NPDC024027 TaxID=3154327 RepID=UPI0033C06B4C